MQDIFLRVLVVGVGLIMSPREDPGVKEDDLNASMREWEEKLLGEMEGLAQEMTPLNMKVSQDEPDRSFVNFKSQEETTESEINHKAAPIDIISLLGHFEVTQTDPEVMHGNVNKIVPLGQLDIANSDHKSSQEHQNRLDHTMPKMNVGEQQEESVTPGVNKKTDMESGNYLSNQQTLPLQKEVFEHEKSMPSSDQEVKPLTDTAADYHTVTTWEDDYMWFLWNTYSIISVIHFLYRYLRRNPQSHTQNSTTEDTKISNVRNLSADVKLPDNDILHQFYNKCVHVSPSESGRIGDFVEGIANDLLEAMRNMADKEVGMAMKDLKVVEDACGSGVCKVIIPFLPLEPHGFQFQLWNGQAGEMPQDRGPQGWYRIKMVGGVSNDDCPCGSSNKGGDLLCLLHCERQSVGEMTEVFDGPLCQRNTPYLSRVKVKQWFQNEIRRAWEHISHKYDLAFSYKDSSATVTIRFRSGKMISFQMTPVVKLFDTEVYFTIVPCSTTKATSETIWSPSLTIYENRFLKHLEKGFPKLSCHIQSLNILLFLNEKQAVITGRSALKYQHYKTALMHLLASKESCDWHPENLASRTRDLLSFVENSLHQRILHQIRLRTPMVPKEVEMPSAVYETTPVNLLHPLLVQNDIYIKTIQHFQEMLKNTQMLIQEYLSSK